MSMDIGTLGTAAGGSSAAQLGAAGTGLVPGGVAGVAPASATGTFSGMGTAAGAGTGASIGAAATTPEGIAPSSASMVPGAAPTGAPASATAPTTATAGQAPITEMSTQASATDAAAAAKPGILSQITDALGLSNMSGTTKVGLGMMGMNTYTQMQAKKQASAFAQQMASLGAPLTAASNQLLQQYESGQLSPNDEHTINKFIQDNKAQVNSYYSQAGLGNSSMAQQALQAVDTQAAAMKDQIRQNMLSSASQLAAQGNAPVIAGIQQQVSEDQALQQSQANMLASLAQLATMGQGGQKKPGG